MSSGHWRGNAVSRGPPECSPDRSDPHCSRWGCWEWLRMEPRRRIPLPLPPPAVRAVRVVTHRASPFSLQTRRTPIRAWLWRGGCFIRPSTLAASITTTSMRLARTASALRASSSLPRSKPTGRRELFKTDATFSALITAYPGAGPINRYSGLLLTKIHDAPPTNFTGHGNVTETWTPLADLTVTASGNVYRSNGLFGTGGNGTTPGAAITPSYLLSTTSISTQQQYVNSFGAQLAVEKRSTIGHLSPRRVITRAFLSTIRRP